MRVHVWGADGQGDGVPPGVLAGAATAGPV